IAKAEHAVAVVERRAVDKVDNHLAEAAFEDRRRELVRSKRDEEVGHDRLQTVTADVDLAVPGKNDAHVVAEAAQFLGQRSRHIRHAAKLREWRKLRRRDQDLEVLRMRDLDRSRLDGNAETARR